MSLQLGSNRLLPVEQSVSAESPSRTTRMLAAKKEVVFGFRPWYSLKALDRKGPPHRPICSSCKRLRRSPIIPEKFPGLKLLLYFFSLHSICPSISRITL